MAINKISRHWLRLLLIVPVIVALSFTSVAFAQEDQQQQVTAEGEEMAARNFVTVEQRQQVRNRDLTRFDDPAYRAQWCNQDSWIVRGGESLGHIVINCNIAMANILAVNPQISNPDLVYVGEEIRLPTQEQRRVTPGHANTTLTLTAAQQEYFNQFVTQADGEGIPVTGEDAEDIFSRNYGTDAQLREARTRDLARFDDPNYRAQWCNRDHWVFAPGETLGHVAIQCGIPLDVLLAHNHQISNGDIVVVGEIIRLPADPFASAQPFLTEAQLNYLQGSFDTTPADQ
jgi:N-acetylmuramoyl-L-alanine amidase